MLVLWASGGPGQGGESKWAERRSGEAELLEGQNQT